MVLYLYPRLQLLQRQFSNYLSNYQNNFAVLEDDKEKKEENTAENNKKSKEELSSPIEKDPSDDLTNKPEFSQSLHLESTPVENETCEEICTAYVNPEPSNHSVDNYVDSVTDDTIEYNYSQEDDNVAELDVPQLPGMSKREMKEYVFLIH